MIIDTFDRFSSERYALIELKMTKWVRGIDSLDISDLKYAQIFIPEAIPKTIEVNNSSKDIDFGNW